MKLDRAYFAFVFGDETWRRKALTAGLLAVVGVVVLLAAILVPIVG